MDAFEPIALSRDILLSLEDSTRRALFLDLLRRGNAPLAERMLEMRAVPFRFYSGSSFDTELSDALCEHASLRAFEIALDRVLEALPAGSPPPDFGTQISSLLAKAGPPNASSPPEGFELAHAKIRSLLDRGFPFHRQWDAWRFPERAPEFAKSHRCAPSFALALGYSELFFEMAERSAASAGAHLFSAARLSGRSGDAIADLLLSRQAWAAFPEECSKAYLLCARASLRPDSRPAPQPLFLALTQGTAQTREALLDLLGDQALSSLRGAIVGHQSLYGNTLRDEELWRLCAQSDRSDGSFRMRESMLRASLGRSKSKISAWFLSERLFSEDSLERSAAWDAYRMAPEGLSDLDRSIAADPWSRLLDSGFAIGFPRLLSLARGCGDPALLSEFFERAGIDRLLSAQGSRSGLDPSFLMLMAEAPLESFSLALDFAAKSGRLEEALSQKAWVITDPSRKKGDALAFCVSRGKLDHAQAIIERSPALWRSSPAKAVIEVMARSGDERAARALSSFENLALSKARQSLPDPSAPPARARRGL